MIPNEAYFPRSWVASDPEECKVRMHARATADALRGQGPVWLSTAEAAATLGVDRGTLDRLAAAACTALPGAVLRVGEGRSRKTYRWDRAQLGAAVAAAQAAYVEPAPKPRKKRTPRAKPKGSSTSLRSLVA